MRLRSNRVVLPSGTRPATVHLHGGRIASIEPDGGADIDYGDLVIMPGLIDSHVHVNEPGRTEWEGFASATRAAAAGGITTIVDMPLNSLPPTTTLAALQEKRRVAHGDVRVELWGGVIPGNTHELRPMLQAGARGFKCFLVHSGVDEFPNVNERQLREAAKELAPTGAPLLVHAELPEHLLEPEGDPARHDTWLHSRPNAAEDAAIELLVRVCADTGARIHVVHLSSASALPLLREARSRNLPITAETTPHYLHFASETIPDARTEFKCAPPIREEENRELLWDALREGLLDIIVSDHSPCTPQLKQGDFVSAWGGISSMQLALPVIWTNAQPRGFELVDLVRWCSQSPARLAGLAGKCILEHGFDADLVIWAPEETFVVEPSMIQHRHKVTPYLGSTLRGVVKETWVGGVRVF